MIEGLLRSITTTANLRLAKSDMQAPDCLSLVTIQNFPDSPGSLPVISGGAATAHLRQPRRQQLVHVFRK